MSFSTPILFLIFNRPDTTEQVFAKIKEIKPKYLFVAADGPRTNKDGEKELCEQTRKTVINAIDWECEVKTLLRDENLGCGLAVSSAITWFFDNVEEGIILEDDTLPSMSFFSYCEEMLNKYKHDSRILHISGSSYINPNLINESYYFTRLPFIWGWATWRRAWVLYKFDTKYYPFSYKKQILQNVFSNQDIVEYWSRILERFHLLPKSFTWDYQWFLSIWENEGVVIQPQKNLVKNIGFGEGATHTVNVDDKLSKIEANEFKIANYLTDTNVNIECENSNFYFYFINKKNITNKQESNSFFNYIRKVNLSFTIKKKIKLFFKKILVGTVYDIISDDNLSYKIERIVNHKKTITNSFLDERLTLYTPCNISNSQIGGFTYLAPNSKISMTSIGKFCSIGPNFFCGWGIHPTNGISSSPMFYSTLKQNGITLSHTNKVQERKQITIGNDVFIGMNVTVLDGVTIGDGAVIGAGAVVSKDIPPYAIAVGCPIQIIKYRFEDKQIEALLKIKWWDFPEEKLHEIEEMFFNVDEFIIKNNG